MSAYSVHCECIGVCLLGVGCLFPALCALDAALLTGQIPETFLRSQRRLVYAPVI